MINQNWGVTLFTNSSCPLIQGSSMDGSMCCSSSSSFDNEKKNYSKHHQERKVIEINQKARRV